MTLPSLLLQDSPRIHPTRALTSTISPCLSLASLPHLLSLPMWSLHCSHRALPAIHLRPHPLTPPHVETSTVFRIKPKALCDCALPLRPASCSHSPTARTIFEPRASQRSHAPWTAASVLPCPLFRTRFHALLPTSSPPHASGPTKTSLSQGVGF